MRSSGSALGLSAWFKLLIFLFTIELPKDPGIIQYFLKNEDRIPYEIKMEQEVLEPNILR